MTRFYDMFLQKVIIKSLFATPFSIRMLDFFFGSSISSSVSSILRVSLGLAVDVSFEVSVVSVVAQLASFTSLKEPFNSLIISAFKCSKPIVVLEIGSSICHSI